MRVLPAVMAVTAGLAAAGCYRGIADPPLSARDAEWMSLMPKADVEPGYGRYLIDDPTGEKPGTVVVNTKERQLYFVLPDRKAIRYGVSVGNEAFGWTGTAKVARKAEWPDWYPPPAMIKRWPHVHEVSGGPASPLGARALYLFEGKRDTLYRIHGTNEPEKIGQAVSSGCIRMRNVDVVDLYNRIQLGAKVVVM
jgi:lipoprotein-anchoring transpeptidase ErfK/SrfK